MQIYGLKACDTCRKALKAIQASDQAATLIDVRATPLSREQLTHFLDTLGAGLLNTRSTTWRGLPEVERARAPIDLLCDHPTLMKRPVIERDGVLYLGWTGAVQEALRP